MNTETAQLLERHFDIALETPDGVKKLRELILTLAMKGKLVKQDPNDQPASELLKEIEAEKLKLIADGKIKGSRNDEEITEEEAPYELPEGWEWCRIGSICHDWGQKEPDKNFTYIDVGAIDNTKGIITSDIQVLESKGAPSRARKIVKKGTVIYSTVRPYLLNIAIIEKDYTPEPIASTAFAIIHPFGGIYNRFIYLYLHSRQFIGYVEFHMKGVAYPAINDGNFYQGPFPLPPLAEQKRIVTKIDELMALCDKLEAERDARNKKRLAIHAAAINGLLAAPDKAAFNTSWSFITGHFNDIYSVAENVAELKKAILQLAVMGKLVKQDPNDQPASELLKEIAADPSTALRARKKEVLLPIKAEEVPFEVPKGWEWVRLGNVAQLIGGFAYKSGSFKTKGDNQVLRLGNIRPNYLRLDEHPVFIPASIARETRDYCLNSGDILITMTGTRAKRDYLYTARVDKNPISGRTLYLNQRVGAIRLFFDSYFINLSLKDEKLRDIIYATATGSANQANIGMAALRDWTIPLPPLAEQKRIVVKVDELMAICNILEKQIGEAEVKRAEIFDAVLARV